MNPTSPLGSGGLAWYICFQPLFFSTLRVSTLWGGVYPSPYPCIGMSPPRPSWERERQRTRTFSGGGERERKRERQTETPQWNYDALPRPVREEEKKSINKNQPKSESKIDQKSMQNQSKIDQKSTKNGSKIDQKLIWGLQDGKLEAQDRSTRPT